MFLNPPVDAQGNPITNESALREFLHENQLIDGIYLVPNSDNTRDFAFVPARTYCLGNQQHADFLNGGLARGFQHGFVNARPNLSALACSELYPQGTFVSDAYKPIGKGDSAKLSVAGLGSYWSDVGRLSVRGNYFGYCGYASGVLDSAAEGSASQK